MTDGVQVNAPLLLKQQVKQQFVPRSQLVQGQKVQLPIGQTATNGSKRNGSQFVSAIQLKPNNQPVPATGVYRKIAQPFSRPGEFWKNPKKFLEKFFYWTLLDDQTSDRPAVFHAKRYSKQVEESVFDVKC